MRSDQVCLSFKDGVPRPDTRLAFSAGGFSLEHVRINERRAFDYDWRGTSHYLALHDIDLSDGETMIEGARVVQGGELRDRMTFAPKDCRVQGWTALADGNHGYLALFFAPDLAEAEHERPLIGSAPGPLVYFSDPSLNWTLRRLQRLIGSAEGFDTLAAETLCLAAALQLYAVQGFSAPGTEGRLAVEQQRRVEEYIAASLNQPITLAELAGVAGTSRFHFARAFRRTYGQPPHQYLLRRRIAQAVTLLGQSRLAIAAIAELTGFTSPARLSTAFRRTMGCSPRTFRERAA